MPRRHPIEDDKKTGPSPTAIAERRRHREERREKKSPGEDKAALLVNAERRVLVAGLHDMRRLGSDDAEANRQFGSLQRELERDDVSRRANGRRNSEV